MKENTIQLVQNSFQDVLPIADQAMVLFYDNLFRINPSTKLLFPTDAATMSSQRNKLRDMLAAAVKGLSNLDTLVPILQNLGKRHVDYGVLPSHYNDVGAALIGALETGLGDGFTTEVREAWVEVYGVMSDTMIAAANEV